MRVRRASRVLLIDPEDRVLLLRGNGWWFTVGGGIEPDESGVAAAVREALEETGIALDPAALSPVLLETVNVLQWDEGLVEQHDEFRAVRVADGSVDTAGFTALEQATIDEVRWWSEGELRASDERIAPRGLADLLSGVLAAGVPR